MASNQFDCTKLNPVRRVRLVAKVRGFSGPVGEASRTVNWVSVNKPEGENSEGVTISFGEQSSSQYLVDYCYEDHEENEIIFIREVKPLISAVFEGHNSTVIAYGARGSGKTHVIQGSDEKQGLAALSISEFLSMAEKNGKCIALSFYEVDHQEHAVDLLNPGQPPILVFEDRGRIQFKGLTQTPVKSIAEFQNLYLTACSARKATPKKGYEHACRSHMGLTVHVFSKNETIETGLVSKMNFVDLTGYEDARKKSIDVSCHAEINKINKSIYALLNVCQALSTNDNRVPYRESKLTRILQDTLRGTSKILMVACLNPSFCQDTVYMVSLASRSCQWKHKTPLESTKKNESSINKGTTSQKSKINKSMPIPFKPTEKNESSTNKVPASQKSQMNKSTPTPLESTKRNETSTNKAATSQKSQINKSIPTPLKSTKKNESSANKMVTPQRKQLNKSISAPLDSAKKNESSAKKVVTSHKIQVPKSISTTAKRLPGSRSNMYEKKDVVAKPATKGRKLFDEASHSAKADKAMPLSAMGSTSETSMLEEDNSLPDASSNVKLNVMVEEDHSSLNANAELELHPIMEKGICGDGEDQDHQENHAPYVGACSEVQEGMSTENSSLMSNEVGSPPISSQLRDLSNSLKLLYSSTPLSVQIPEMECTPLNDQISTDIVEPKTPITEQNMRVIDRWDVMNAKSPWEAFSMRGSGMKNSLVQEYLKLLNTADKDELKKLKGIGEKRATYILQLRQESPEYFKSLDDLKDVGLSAKQVKELMKKEVGGLFS
ncbi:PREDICTED: kinesin-like protein KIN-10C isoform X2 [Lupinus angustifolius]|uniref:kinesin-like protein KIN-10C isoform X2 n=1 Tax=Lupinus angustifolius TaxID=3871 RepID=UPI00092F5A0D|nr:PREDICTED: kinesin-like protein KIN-10C isoform X2 [Lupinus angustifolius]